MLAELVQFLTGRWRYQKVLFVVCRPSEQQSCHAALGNLRGFATRWIWISGSSLSRADFVSSLLEAKWQFSSSVQAQGSPAQARLKLLPLLGREKTSGLLFSGSSTGV